MSTLGKNAAFSLLYRVGNVLFPLLSGMYLARVLAPEALGQVASARNTASYFLLLAALGIPQYALREAARCREHRESLNKLVSELLVLQWSAGAVSICAYLLLICLPRKDPLLWIFSLELLFQMLNLDWLFEGREAYRFIALRSLGVRICSFLALLLLVRGPEDVSIYGLLLCLGTGANHLLNLCRTGVRFTCRDLHPRRHLAPVLTLMLSGLAASLYSKVDITMLSLLAYPAAVGYYTTAYKVIGLVLTVATAFSAVYFPRLSRSREEDFSRYLSAGLQMLLVITLPATLGLMLVSEDLVRVLFGDAFLPAARTLQILAPMVLIRGCGDLLCYQAIISAGKESWLISARVWAGLANIGLNALLIPRLGQDGAALATLVSEGLVNGILLPRGIALGKPVLKKSLLLTVALAAGAMAPAVLLIRTLTENPYLSLLLSVAAGAAVYGACLGLARVKEQLEVYNGT